MTSQHSMLTVQDRAAFRAGQMAINHRNSTLALEYRAPSYDHEADRFAFDSGLAHELAKRIKAIPMVLKTSNARKLAEFRRFGLSLDAQAGEDLAEVDGTPEEVVKYKALAAGPGVLVEDTSLDVDGYAAGVNIRWLLEDVMQKMRAEPGAPEPRALWRVLVAVHYDGRMYSTGSEVRGRLIPEPRGEGFSFDCYFVPDGQSLTLGELDLVGKKDAVSARRSAISNLLSGHCHFEGTSELPSWTGSYQAAA